MEPIDLNGEYVGGDGAVLRVHLERARAYQGQGGAPEIHARVISIEIEPKRPPALRKQLSNKELQARVAA